MMWLTHSSTLGSTESLKALSEYVLWLRCKIKKKILTGLRGETLWMCVQGRHGGEGTSETPPRPPSCPGLSSLIRQEVTMVSLFPADQLRVVAPGAHHPWKSISSHLPAPREPLTSLY